MFRQMRRKKQQLSQQESEKILAQATSGVLAVLGDDGYPYAVPLSFAYCDGHIYFHCAKSGHKLDAIAREEKASFCVICEDHVVSREYTTYFKSVIAFGKMRRLDSQEEKWAGIEKLALKYAPLDSRENREQAILKEFPPLCVLEMRIEHLTGKQSIELVGK